MVVATLDGVSDLYFVARGNGRHMFSETYEGHLANIRMIRAAQASADSGADSALIARLKPGARGARRARGL